MNTSNNLVCSNFIKQQQQQNPLILCNTLCTTPVKRRYMGETTRKLVWMEGKIHFYGSAGSVGKSYLYNNWM